MSPRHRKPILLMCLALFTFTLPWFSVSSARASDSGLHLRFAHFAADVQPVDVYANGNPVAKNLKYKEVTDYLALEMAGLEFVITPAGGTLEDSLLDKPIQFAPGEGAYFTLALIGSAQAKTFELVKLPVDGSEAIGSAVSGQIAASGAWARATAKPGMATQAAGQMAGMSGMSDMGAVSAAYLLIKNTGDKPDQLVGVACDAAETVETHKTTVVNNMAKMEPVPAIDVPANGSVELKPGGYHIMLMKLKHDLLQGQTITLTLTFQSGVKLTIIAPVKAP